MEFTLKVKLTRVEGKKVGEDEVYPVLVEEIEAIDLWIDETRYDVTVVGAE